MPLQIPEKLGFLLFEKRRYKVAHGGRGSGKSWSFARCLLEIAARKPVRILCAREVQNTIKDSVHRLLCDQIETLGHAGRFSITDNEIRGANGSLFFFRGLRSNVTEVKSMEGIDYCWVEEAERVSDDSWEVLIPTIRKADAEIWISFNDHTEHDPVYERFVTVVRDDAIVEKVNYYDNPWFPDVLRKEMEWDKEHDPIKYRHVWLGDPEGYSGKVYPIYNENVHLKEYDIQTGYLGRCNCFMGIDPHRRYYPFIKWYAITPDDRVWIYNEWPSYETMLNKYYDEIRDEKQFDMTLEHLAGIILANDMSMFGAEIKWRVIDPRFNAENPDFAIRLSEYGVTGFRAPPFERIEEQRNNLKGLLHYNANMPVNEFNCPGWYVSPRCKNSRRAYARHYWKEEVSGRTNDGVESEEYKDPLDVDRYFLALHGGVIRYEEKKKPKRDKVPEMSPYKAEFMKDTALG